MGNSESRPTNKDSSKDDDNQTVIESPTNICSDDAAEPLTADDTEEFNGWVLSSNEIRIMVGGKTGVGKSALLNGIIGEKFFEEGDDFDPQTTTVDEKRCTKGGVEIVVFDTPGLQDGSGNEEEYLSSMKEKCKDIHLLMYCINMLETRADLSVHSSALKMITDCLGVEVWEHAIIVLTFANVYEDRLRDREVTNLKKSFLEKVNEWETYVVSSLRECGVPDEALKGIKAVPTGYHTKPDLEVQRFWLSNVWMLSLHHMKDTAQAAMIKIAHSRFLDEEDVKLEDLQGDIASQPIVFTKTKKAIGGVTSGAAGAVVGATTGALIGALLIGIPSFGVFAGLGLAIGALGGGAVGTSSGVALSMLVMYFRQKRKKKKLEKAKLDALERLSEHLATNTD